MWALKQTAGFQITSNDIHMKHSHMKTHKKRGYRIQLPLLYT